MTFNAGYFMANAFPVGYYPENYFTEYGLAAPPQTASRLRTIITKMENRQPTSIWKAHVWKPGLWRNGNGLVDKVIEKMEQH